MKKRLLVLSAVALIIAGCGEVTPSSSSFFSSSSSTQSSSEIKEAAKYTITFKNDDGTILDTLTVKEGEKPVYSKDNPTKDGNAQYTYLFKSWDKEIASASKDEVYTATYIETLNEYTVNWILDGSTLASETYKYGDIPSYKNGTPNREETAQYSFEFAGWSPELSEVVGEVNYTATFTETLKEYTVTWEDRFYDTITTETYKYGETPEFKGNVEESYEDETSIYTHIGWSPEVSEVTGDITYHAEYESEFKTFDITWLDVGGNVLSVDSYEYGTTPVCEADIPSEIELLGKPYLYNGWDKEIVPVTCDATYQVTYTLAPWSNLSSDYSVFRTADVLSTSKDSELSVWTDPSFQARDDQGWKGGTFETSWRTIMIVDADGQVLYAVKNPANGYGGPSGTGYYRAEAYEGENYVNNPAFTILPGYGKWTAEEPTAAAKFLLNVPEGGFMVTAYNSATTSADLIAQMVSGGAMSTATNDLNQSHPERSWYDVRVFYNPVTNKLVAYKK